MTEKAIAKENLSFEQAHSLVNSIFNGECSEIAIAGFLTSLAAKGEAADEIAGMARALRDHAVPVAPENRPVVDLVGTGGDGRHTINISTIASIVAAGAGVRIAKHGNRAITSKCGAADILAALGVNLNAGPQTIARCIDQAGMGFMFAPNHHPAMKFVQPVRKALGFRTVFNILGPLANPAAAELQIIGVANKALMPIMAQALQKLGVQRAMVIHGDGMDEFTTAGPTDMIELRQGHISEHVIDYSDYGFQKADPADYRGGAPEENLRFTQAFLNNEITGPKRDVILLNAAAVLMIAGLAPGLFEGIRLADQSIASGQAKQVLTKMIDITNKESA
jgi:anthranilate phosphoribosyltransferase